LKQAPKDRTFIHAAGALERDNVLYWKANRKIIIWRDTIECIKECLKYQKTIPEKLANKSNLSRHKVEI